MASSTPISARKTGVARTMICGPVTRAAPWRSADAASRLDLPDVLDDAAGQAAAHDDITVVQVDGRIAVAGDEPDGLAERRQAGPRGIGVRTQDAVLVAAAGVGQLALPDARRAGIDRVRLVAGVDDRVRRAATHHLALDEERVLEARRVRRGDVVGVVAVHEEIAAHLQLAPDAARDVERERAGARARDQRAGDAGGADARLRRTRQRRGVLRCRRALVVAAQVLGRA